MRFSSIGFSAQNFLLHYSNNATFIRQTQFHHLFIVCVGFSAVIDINLFSIVALHKTSDRVAGLI